MVNRLSPRLRGQCGGRIPRAVIHHDHTVNQLPGSVHQGEKSYPPRLSKESPPRILPANSLRNLGRLPHCPAISALFSIQRNRARHSSAIMVCASNSESFYLASASRLVRMPGERPTARAGPGSGSASPAGSTCRLAKFRPAGICARRRRGLEFLPRKLRLLRHAPRQPRARPLPREPELAEMLDQHRPASVTDVNIQTGEDPVAVREVVLPLIETLRRETSLWASASASAPWIAGTLRRIEIRRREHLHHEVRNRRSRRNTSNPSARELDGTSAQIRLLAANGWQVSSGFIVGLPGQTAA